MSTQTFYGIILLLFFSVHTKVIAQADGGCGCYISICVFNNGQPQAIYDVVHNNNNSAIEFINPGDSIHFSARSIEGCNIGFTLLQDADTIFSDGSNGSLGFSVFDTGQYYFHSFCDILFRNFSLHVLQYMNTGIIQESLVRNAYVYPTRSTGKFHLHSEQVIKQLIVSDAEGRIVKTLSADFSVIDLTEFSPGIYLYAITDESENFFRGKIVKE
jgi:hypothetical protein